MSSEFESQWQSFLMTGFRDWIPQAFMVWTQLPSRKGKPPITPDQILRWMVGLWIKTPEEDGNGEQSTEQHIAMAMALTRKAGGKIVGRKD